MRKIIGILMLLLLVTGVLGGCGGFPAITLEPETPLPQDGIVSKDFLQKIKDENRVVVLYGESGSYRYAWTVFGKELDDVSDVDLSLEITDATESTLAFQIGSGVPIELPILLSIYLPEGKKGSDAVLYCGSEALGSVLLTEENGQTILHFPITAWCGLYTVRPAEQENNLPVRNDLSNGTATGQDLYRTDPIPAGKPLPSEPENQTIRNDVQHTCTFSIECTSVFQNLGNLAPDKLEILPSDGIFFARQTVSFSEGESVFNVLQRVCREAGIHMESSFTPIYNSAYIEGIGNLYEFDCGDLSGWMYRVNGWYPNYGCSRYRLAPGDVVEWRFTCRLGRDIGCEWLSEGEEP